jgi:hypothetical protein
MGKLIAFAVLLSMLYLLFGELAVALPFAVILYGIGYVLRKMFTAWYLAYHGLK